MHMNQVLRSGRESLGGCRLALCALAEIASGLATSACQTQEEYTDPRLHLTVESLDPALANRWGAEGVVASAVADGSPLTVGDLVTHVAYRTPVSSDDELRSAMKRAMGPRKYWWQIGRPDPSDGSALLEVERNGSSSFVELATRDPRNWDETGVVSENLRLTTVDLGYEDSPTESPARTSGLLADDRVVAVINEEPVPDVRRFRKAMGGVSASSDVYVFTHELTGIRLQAITALGEIASGKPAVRDRLLGIMEQAGDPATRRTAARALERIARSEVEPTLLEEMLPHLLSSQEPDERIRRSAAATIQVLVEQLGADAFDAAAIQTVALAMEDEDPGVHFATGAILSDIGDPAVPVLTAALEGGGSLRVRDIAATALGNIGGDAAREALIGTLPLTEDVPLQLTIASALSEIGDASARRALRTLESGTEHSGLREFVRQLLEPVPTGNSGI